MFLFTTSDPRWGAKAAPATAAARLEGARSPVIEAIRHGANQTDTSFDFLVRTAQRESALDPGAKARTSSASGLFQFIEQTWLGILKSDGDRHGLSAAAGSIRERGGHYSVDDPQSKRDILALRHDPRVASVMAGVLTQRNREVLVGGLGREPNASDLYVAHVLGAGGAQNLIRAAQNSPGKSAAAHFPEAAAANRPIFYDRAGRSRTVSEVYAVLAAGHASTAAPVAVAQSGGKPAGDQRDRRDPAGGTSDTAAGRQAPASHGIFGTDGRRGALSDSVKRLWTTGPRREPVKIAANVAGFFPRAMSDAGPARVMAPLARAEATADEAPASAGETPPLDFPLPPRRPGLAGSGSVLSSPISTAPRPGAR